MSPITEDFHPLVAIFFPGVALIRRGCVVKNISISNHWIQSFTFPLYVVLGFDRLRISNLGLKLRHRGYNDRLEQYE